MFHPHTAPTSHKRKPRKPTHHLLAATSTLLAALCLLSSLPASTFAQKGYPVGSRRVGFTTLDDVLYIQGGFDTVTSNQFVSLDLSSSWDTSAPAWTILKDGQSTSHLALASISAGVNGGSKGSILAIGGMPASTGPPNFFAMYDINSASWTNTMNSVKPPYPALEGHAVVSDPNNGLIYMIGGFNGTSAPYLYNTLSVYDPKSRTMVSQQAGTAATSLTDVAAVWSTQKNSILTFGGSRASPATTNAMGGEIQEYDVSAKSWKTMSTSGDAPSARLDHCMAASEDGSKIVLFGGTDDSNNLFYNSIYILDVKSGKWKQGTPAPVARTRMACTFHSYQFIAWGGSSGGNRNTMLTNIPAVYDLNTDKWVDSYDADNTEKGSNVGAIIGGVVAVAAIGGAIAFVMIRRRRTRQREREEAFKSNTLAANMASMEDDNIKVEAPDSPRLEYGNQYPLNKMENSNINNSIASPQQQQQYPAYGIQSPAVAYQQYGGDHSGYVPSPYPQYNGAFGPGGEYGPEQYGAYPSHIQQQGYPPAPNAADYIQQPNPFMSPEDYHSQAAGAASSVSSGSSNPFTNAAATPTVASAVSPSLGYQSSPRIAAHDPFQSTQTAPWNGTYPGQQTMSPSPGARAPQVIPESATTTSYVPPPAPL